MGAICGILGEPDAALLRLVAARLEHRGHCDKIAEGPDFLVMSSSGPAGRPSWAGDGVPLDRLGKALPAEAIEDTCKRLLESRPVSIGLHGAFAFVASIEAHGAWCLLRDRLGRRPLYYTQIRDTVIFASEMKALVPALPARHLNLQSVDRYFMLRCVPAPDTILQGVSCVQPGHALIVRGGQCWQLPFGAFDLATERNNRAHVADALEQALESAVVEAQTERLLFSSGIDSASLAVSCRGVKPVFISLERAWQDEARLTRESAARIHVPLLTLPGRRITEDTFSRAVRALDVPLADPTVLPLWSLFEAARESGDAYMTGYGADEILGGFPRFNLLRHAGGAHKILPPGLLNTLQPVLPPNIFIKRAGRYLSGARQTPAAVMQLVEVFTQDERDDLYTAAMRAAVETVPPADRGLHGAFVHGDVTRDMLALDLRVGLPELVLGKCDRLAAAHGITLEHPFLADRVLDVALRIHPNQLYGVRSKAILRKAMRHRLPGRTLLSARRDFVVPQEGRGARLIETLAEKIVTPDRIDASGVLRWHAVEQIMRSASHNIYRRRQFWAILMFFAWYREFMEA